MADAADQERPDRISGKQAVQQVCDADFVPHQVSLNECQAPRINGVQAASDQLGDGARLDERVEVVVSCCVHYGSIGDCRDREPGNKSCIDPIPGARTPAVTPKLTRRATLNPVFQQGKFDVWRVRQDD